MTERRVAMGILKDIFGSNGDRVTPSENEAERDARSDYIEEARDNDGRDPISKEPPAWAKDIGPSDRD